MSQPEAPANTPEHQALRQDSLRQDSIRQDYDGAWKAALEKKLKAAGLSVSANGGKRQSGRAPVAA